jgi:hypothetical protein
MITWEDISSNIVYSKLTGEEPNPIFKEIHSFLQYWIPSIIPDTKVYVNDKYSYHYDSEYRHLWIGSQNIWRVFKSKYDMKNLDIESLIHRYVSNTQNISVSSVSQDDFDFITENVSIHNI